MIASTPKLDEFFTKKSKQDREVETLPKTYSSSLNQNETEIFVNKGTIIRK